MSDFLNREDDLILAEGPPTLFGLALGSRVHKKARKVFFSAATEPFVFRTKKNSSKVCSAGPRIVSPARRWGKDVKTLKNEMTLV